MSKYDELKKHVNILLIDDDVDYVDVTAFFMRSKGYNVSIATNGADGIEKVKNGDIQIVLLDYYMPGLTGEDVIKEIRKFNKEIIVIMQTGFAGQQPPSDTLKRLNIQNFHDKSDGVDKLLLQVMSAIRVFNQQNEIMLSKYRINAIGKLIKGIAEEMKSPIMSLSAGIEATNSLIEESVEGLNRDTMVSLKKFYDNNKRYLEKIDKILTAVIHQSNDRDNEEFLTGKEIIERIELIILSEIKTSGVILEKELLLRAETLITGTITDVIFIICEVLKDIMNVSEIGNKIKMYLKEDEKMWYIELISENIEKLEKSKTYRIRNIIVGLNNVEMEIEQNKISVKMHKE
ncbi:MAG: response regulator [Clostridia bacterium]|nr:response regulator [Clostridia bacterium]